MLRESLIELKQTRQLLSYITEVAHLNFCSEEVLDEIIKIRCLDIEEPQDNPYDKEVLRKLKCFNIKEDEDLLSVLLAAPKSSCMKNLHFRSKDGFYIHRDRFTIPVINPAGDITTWVSYKKGAMHKYVTSKTYGFSKKTEFYGNYLECIECKFGIVVEGMFDRIRLECEGYSALATMGTNLTATKHAILDSIPYVIFITDNDRAGNNCIAQEIKYTNTWYTNSKYCILKINSRYKDIDSLLGYKKNLDIFRDVINDLTATQKQGKFIVNI